MGNFERKRFSIALMFEMKFYINFFLSYSLNEDKNMDEL